MTEGEPGPGTRGLEAHAREALRRQARGELVNCPPGTAIRAAAMLEANRDQLDTDSGEAPE